MANHLGNVLVVVSDRKLPVDNNTDGIVDYYMADVISANDYYAFGAPMPGRSFNSTDYKYGFNGKEKDDEITGSSGTDYDFGARIYDARLGRFLSVDPMRYNYPSYSPYLFAGNTPIQAIDLEGKNIYYVNKDGTVLDLSIAGNLEKVDNENLRNAYTTLLRTSSGKDIINFFQSSTMSGHDIYIQTETQHSYQAKGNYVCSTVYDVAGQGKVVDGVVGGITKSLDQTVLTSWNGLDVSRSEGKTVDLIALSGDHFNTTNPFVWSTYAQAYVRVPTLNNYELAEALYHEIYAHIIIPASSGAADSDHWQKYSTTDYEHIHYGAENTGLHPQGSTPHNRISYELDKVRMADQVKNSGSTPASKSAPKSKPPVKAKF
jgi:RHS repeat-associated protein